jgi:hypothetical protein
VTQPWSKAPGALFPDPDTAREWLSRELSRPEYQESLLERFSRWFNGLLDAASEAAAHGGMNPVVAVLLLVLLVAGTALALSRLRVNPTPATHGAAVFSDARQTAAEHRRRALGAIEEEQWGSAVVESVRALAAGLVERGLMPEQSDVTVHEMSDRAAELFPAHRPRLEVASRVFDETRYGDRPAVEGQARDAVELERELAAANPDETGARSPVRAVPR